MFVIMILLSYSSHSFTNDGKCFEGRTITVVASPGLLPLSQYDPFREKCLPKLVAININLLLCIVSCPQLCFVLKNYI